MHQTVIVSPLLLTFATWVSSCSQQRPGKEYPGRERERLLWSGAEDVCGLILADPGERGQLAEGSWSRWDTRTLARLVDKCLGHPPGTAPPRGPPSSLNSRLGCIRDTGAQPNPESPLLPEAVETVQLLANVLPSRDCVLFKTVRVFSFLSWRNQGFYCFLEDSRK